MSRTLIPKPSRALTRPHKSARTRTSPPTHLHRRNFYTQKTTRALSTTPTNSVNCANLAGWAGVSNLVHLEQMIWFCKTCRWLERGNKSLPGTYGTNCIQCMKSLNKNCRSPRRRSERPASFCTCPLISNVKQQPLRTYKRKPHRMGKQKCPNDRRCSKWLCILPGGAMVIYFWSICC